MYSESSSWSVVSKQVDVIMTSAIAMVRMVSRSSTGSEGVWVYGVGILVEAQIGIADLIRAATMDYRCASPQSKMGFCVN